MSIVFFVSAYGQHQKMLFEHVSMADGLSQVTVNDILQDTTGFLWFGTQDGLNCYDGYNFKVFKPNRQDSTSISSNNITKLFQDSYGNIWVGTVGGGLNLFDPLTQSFKHFMNDPEDSKSLGNNDVFAIFEDTDGDLWIGTYGGGLNKFNRETQDFTVYKYDKNNPNSISGNTVMAINQDNMGYIWIGLDAMRGLNRFDKKTGKFTSVPFSQYDFMEIYKDSKGRFWVAMYYGGFNIFDPRTGWYTNYRNHPDNPKSLSSDIVKTFYEDTINNKMYIGTRGGGLNVFDLKTMSFIGNEVVRDDEFSISENNVLSILCDKSGVLWVGTESTGLNKYNTERKKFKLIHPSQLHDDPIKSDNVFAIYEDDKNGLWVGVRGSGLCYINKTTGEIKNIQSKNGEKFNINKITSFVYDSRGWYWIGTDGDGIYKFDSETEELESFRYDSENENSIPNDAITALHIDSKKQLWIGTWGGGLVKFDYENKQFTRYTIDQYNYMRNVVWSIYQDAAGDIWVGTNGKGLMKIDKETEELVYFRNDRNDVNSLSHDVVYSSLELKDGTFWLGTGGAGLNKFNLKDKFESYNQQSHDLTNDMVLAMLEDNNGNIWISTYFGLSKFDVKTETFTNYNALDGLQSNSFNERAAYKAKDGTLYFGGQKGLTYFTPDSITNNTYTAPVVITDLKIFNNSVKIGEEILGEKILDKSISYTKELELSYRHNFSIEFATLHYIAPSKNKYKYRLVGFEEDWNYTDATKRFATYTNLAGKDYVFEVCATNNDGQWSDEITQIKITVVPPFWKTTWFYSLIIIVIALLIYIYVKVRERQLLAEKRKLERMVEERTQEINQQKEELQLQSELLVRNNEELSRSNRLIKDSISYAKRIQDVMLPNLTEIQSYLPNSFVLFKPKDIVSGDFYWFSEQNGKLYVAASDCTGHGVPGAFMSMIGTTLLNEICHKAKNQKPSSILEKLNKGIINALKQNKDGNPESQDDGMDITLCCIDKEDSSIQLSCANHIVYMINGDNIDSVEGDICSIGGLFSAHDKGYANFEYKFKPGTKIYMFSDGYQDQFGGEHNKKFMATRFKELLYANRGLSMQEQFNVLDTTFEEWKGTNRQIDDVLVIGIEL